MWRHGLRCVSISTNIVQVLLGEHKYTTTSEANHLRMNVDQIKQYSGYDSSTTDEDFAIAKADRRPREKKSFITIFPL